NRGMRKLAFAALACLAVTVPGCGGGHSSPTEPGVPATRGNWIGTITGTQPGIHLQGTCPLEMDLAPNYNGHWWIDCPGASSQGEVTSLSADGVLVMILSTTSPASDCPWTGLVAPPTPSTLNGSFEADDCRGGPRSTGTFSIHRR
ncbi:MAG: hypothetical protein DMF53_16225, partial [Acidobacteria bacterium]